MIHRVFAFADLPCQGHFRGSDGKEVRAPILHLARGKAVLKCALALEAGLVVAVHVEFPDGERVPLAARVAESGPGGLFLRFEHESDKTERRFGARLVEASASFQERATELREEARNEIRNSVLLSSRTISSRELARKSSEVRVLGMGAITGLIEHALEEALARSDRVFDEESRRRLLEETEASFKERLSTLQAEKAGAVEQAGHLQLELDRARAILEEERQRVIEDDRFTVSDAGMQELEHRLGRLIDHALRGGGVDAKTEEEMRSVVSRLLDDERGKIGEQARGAQSDAIETLERKVQRLAQTLEKSQKARAIAEHRAAALEASGGPGFKNVMGSGLHAEDPTREIKLALLKEIVKENKVVHAFVAERGSGGPSPPERPPAESGGVKKIAVERVKPPPLTRA